MKYFIKLLIFPVCLLLLAYSNFVCADDTIITQKRVKAFAEKQEIIQWKKALESETQRLVEIGHNNLEDVINLVCENTRELEQPAIIVYIEQCIEISDFGNELVREVTKELNPEFEEFDQVISEQTHAMLESSCRENIEKEFIERRSNFIKNYFQNAKISN